jgi:hypothetical protein
MVERVAAHVTAARKQRERERERERETGGSNIPFEGTPPVT